MRILRFDSLGGASGDMVLAALLDLGIEPDELRRALSGLAVGPYEIRVEEAIAAGVRGARVKVEVPPAHHPHRTLPAILELIGGSDLPGDVKDLAVRVFERLAEAEAAVHGTAPDRVTFHEIGAVDSIIDIVGGCWCLRRLAPDAVLVGPLPLGSGVVETQHGPLPVPAPATVELLKGMAVTLTNESSELVTPTGAALLSVWRAGEGGLPASLRLAAAGCGLGHRRLETRANLLRAVLYEEEEAGPGAETCLALECNLDDTSPELVGGLTQRLFEAGALEVFTTPVQMKKQRPGMLLTVLCREESRAVCLDLIFRESTSLGVRQHGVQRTVLPRRWVTVKTPYGAVRVKIGTWAGQDVTGSPEYDDCVARAREHGVSVRSVYEAAAAAVHG